METNITKKMGAFTPRRVVWLNIFPVCTIRTHSNASMGDRTLSMRLISERFFNVY
jgi:hypothetical protein